MGQDGTQRPANAVLFTAKEVAAALGKAEKTVRAGCREGVFDAKKDGIGASTPWRIWCDGHPGAPLLGPVERWKSPQDRADLELEYSDLTLKLRLPPSSHAGGPAPQWKYRHEYLRRRLRRIKDQRFLDKNVVPWPARLPVNGRWYSLRPEDNAWLAELRLMLAAEGENIPAAEPS